MINHIIIIPIAKDEKFQSTFFKSLSSINQDTCTDATHFNMKWSSPMLNETIKLIHTGEIAFFPWDKCRTMKDFVFQLSVFNSISIPIFRIVFKRKVTLCQYIFRLIFKE